MRSKAYVQVDSYVKSKLGKAKEISKEEIMADEFYIDRNPERFELIEAIRSHYVISPLNLINSQYWLAMLVISMILALTVVRVGNDVITILVVLALGVSLALPFILFAQIMTAKFSLKTIKYVSIYSAIYMSLLALALAIYTFLAEMPVLMIVPATIIAFFIWEIRKLFILIDEASNPKNKHIDSTKV